MDWGGRSRLEICATTAKAQSGSQVPCREFKQIANTVHACLSSSPANAEAAQLFREDLKQYQSRVRKTVEASWMDE